MDVWGQQVLAWILGHNKDARLVVHLGDAANIGCTNEFDRFLAVMTAQDRPWVMAPGNHDSLMLGNFSIDRFEGSSWPQECESRGRGSDEHMDKNEFIRRYTTAQGWPLLGTSECTELSPAAASGVAPMVERVIACVYDDSPHVSFIVQQVAVSPTLVAIILDTVVFDEPPSLLRQGGTQGGIGAQQPSIVEAWLERETKQATPRSVLMVGHFALDHLDRTSREQLASLVNRYDVLGYVSAHEHDPTKQLLHPDPSNATRSFPELNVASSLDWPMEYVRASFARTATERALSFHVHGASSELDTASDSSCESVTRWRIPHDDETQLAYSYTAYVPFRWYRSLAAYWLGNRAYGLLRENMYERLGKDLALTKPKLDGIADAELHGGLTADAAIARYERCQARWASEEESQTRYGHFGKEIVWHPPTKATRIRAEHEPEHSLQWTWR